MTKSMLCIGPPSMKYLLARISVLHLCLLKEGDLRWSESKCLQLLAYKRGAFDPSPALTKVFLVRATGQKQAYLFLSETAKMPAFLSQIPHGKPRGPDAHRENFLWRCRSKSLSDT